MKEIVLIALVLAIVIPMLLGNFWFIAVIGYLAETAAESIVDKLFDSIAPD